MHCCGSARVSAVPVSSLMVKPMVSDAHNVVPKAKLFMYGGYLIIIIYNFKSTFYLKQSKTP
jgi:hypothetical protein